MSGYPLQGIVAEKMEFAGFKVTEEWGYIDNDTREHRSLDLFASRGLESNAAAKVIPRLDLLIECKRTIHPYVFSKRFLKSLRRPIRLPTKVPTVKITRSVKRPWAFRPV